MKKSIMTGLVIVSISAASLMASVAHKSGMGHHHGPMMGKIFRQLDLTDAQKEAFKALRAEAKAQREGFRKRMHENKEDLSTLFTPEGFNKAGFVSKATQRCTDRISMRADFMEKAYAILDESQRAQYVSILQEHRDQRAK